jgi:hypothetical protein
MRDAGAAGGPGEWEDGNGKGGKETKEAAALAPEEAEPAGGDRYRGARVAGVGITPAESVSWPKMPIWNCVDPVSSPTNDWRLS